MGIRFLCPQGHKLHVKSFLAGRRGICPHCGARFYIPNQSTPSLRVTEVPQRGKPQDAIASAQTVSSDAHSESVASADEHAHDGGDKPRPGLWYVRGPDGEQYGPADDRVIQRWIEEQRVSADAMVWRDGWDQWRRAGDVFQQDSQPIGSEFDFDPNWLQPVARSSPSTPDDNGELSDFTATPSGRKSRATQKRLIVALVVAVIALAPVAIYVLYRAMTGA